MCSNRLYSNDLAIGICFGPMRAQDTMNMLENLLNKHFLEIAQMHFLLPKLQLYVGAWIQGIVARSEHCLFTHILYRVHNSLKIMQHNNLSTLNKHTCLGRTNAACRGSVF